MVWVGRSRGYVSFAHRIILSLILDSASSRIVSTALFTTPSTSLHSFSSLAKNSSSARVSCSAPCVLYVKPKGPGMHCISS